MTNEILIDEGLEPATDLTGGASQRRLIWLRFRKHRLAVMGGCVIAFLYLVAAFAELIAPSDPNVFAARYTYAPPQQLHLFDDTWAFHPHVNGYKVEVDPIALERRFVVDPSKRIDVGFFVEGKPYAFWGLIPMRVKLFGPKDPTQPFYLWGADRLGRDVFSRMVHGARISLSVGLLGVSLSLMLSIVIGGASGYFGGSIDSAIQRVIEFTRSIPTIPLWLGLSAAMPKDWPPLLIYFCITLILSLIGWTELARVVRGKFLTLKNEAFVIAARLDGASPLRVILRHMLPSFISHIIAAASLAVPGMILAETALSFLGLGLQPPIVSWGVMLQEAQNIRSLASAPWLLAPGVAICVAVLSLNFLGDGLRDAADPYGG
jgi:peptide/nickel transport system permease protein